MGTTTGTATGTATGRATGTARGTATGTATLGTQAPGAPEGPQGTLVGDGPRIDEELATRLRVAVTRLHRRLRQQSLAGLSPAQASALGMVDRLGTPTLGELAVAEQVQPPTMTRLVAGMEATGLVARLADAGDRRICRVRMTAEGRRTLQRIRSLKNAFLTRRLASLDPAEQRAAEELVRLLEHLVAEA